MGDLWTRKKWNDQIIKPINNLINNDTSCPELTPLEEVGPSHIWTKTDIKTIQDKLIEMCEDNEFDDIPDFWKQSIIDDLVEGIEKGCCQCQTTIFERIPQWVPGFFFIPPTWFAHFENFQGLQQNQYPIGPDIAVAGSLDQSVHVLASDNNNTHWSYAIYPTLLSDFTEDDDGAIIKEAGSLVFRTGRIRQDTFVPTTVGITGYDPGEHVSGITGFPNGVYFELFCRKSDPILERDCVTDEGAPIPDCEPAPGWEDPILG